MTASLIQLSSEGDKAFRAYLAVPDQPSGHAVVILQEIFGINANIRGIADEYAAAGYVAIAPDLFWRQQPGVELDPNKPADRESATSLMKGLDQSQAVDDTLVAVAHVRSLPAFRGRVGAVGYCLGGKLAYSLATRSGIDAAVSYYGVGIQGALDEAPRLKCRILLHIAGQDQLCPPEAQASIKKALAPLGSRVLIVNYPAAGHAFARRGGASYDESSARRANEATYQFFAAELGPGR
jgi:carboxymethylenebutenolidase